MNNRRKNKQDKYESVFGEKGINFENVKILIALIENFTSKHCYLFCEFNNCKGEQFYLVLSSYL